MFIQINSGCGQAKYSSPERKLQVSHTSWC